VIDGGFRDKFNPILEIQAPILWVPRNAGRTGVGSSDESRRLEDGSVPADSDLASPMSSQRRRPDLQVIDLRRGGRYDQSRSAWRKRATIPVRVVARTRNGMFTGSRRTVAVA